jgi:signal transduction histidine kinase
MLAAIAEGALLACPLALACATVVAERVRTRRRRELLNRALHELRRPLQALALERSAREPRNGGRDHLAQALTALDGLDREVNGVRRTPRLARVDGRALAAEAVGRWRGPAAIEGRWIELAWHAPASDLVCDEVAISRALDNLIANALEHGRGPIRIDGTRRGARLRLTVADGADAAGAPPPLPARPPVPARIGHRHQAGARRGHGLRIVAEVAAEHGGRFAACAHERGASAVLELPLAPPGP